MSALSKNFASLFFTVVLAFGIGSTASAKKIDALKLAEVKRVGVVSMAGDTLIDRAVGLTVFGNREERHDVAAWNLDADWQGQLVEALSEAAAYEVVAIAPEQRSGLFGAIETGDEEAGRQALVSAAQLAGVDAIIVFGSPEAQATSVGVYPSKYGMLTSNLPFRKRTYYYVVGRLFLFAADGEELDTQYFKGTTRQNIINLPNTAAPEELTNVPFSTYSAEQKEFLRSALRDIPRQEWAWALQKLLETK